MRCAGRKQKHISGIENHFFFLSVFLYKNSGCSFELKEKLFGLVIMKVFSGIGSSNDHYDIITRIYIKIFVAHRRFEQMTIFFNPFKEVKRRQYTHSINF